ncbi:MAG: hypothetical protein U9Q24_02150 [Candidatus Ratteibacteria bacterium]|nr:hypothetical protein [Candidatus Ratteibacteria bacterium]
MTKWGQVGLILAVILTIACVALGVMYYQENEKRLVLEKNIAQVQEEKKVLGRELNQKEQSITQLEQSMKDMRVEFNLQLEQKDTKLTNLTMELKEANEEKGILKVDFSKVKNLRVKLEKKINKIKAEKEQLQTRLTELEQKNESLLARIKNLGVSEAELTLEKIIVREGPQWQGEVLAVDNGYGYAVIGLGIKKGLPQDIILGFFRGEENIGRAKVVQLYENTSVVKIIKQDREILETDIVRNIE